MINAKRDFGGTPSSNTGLNSLELLSGCVVRVDTIAGVCRNVPSLGHAYGIIDLLEKTFSDRVEFDPNLPTSMGKRWDGSTKSTVRGLRFWWCWPKDSTPGQLYIYAGGAVLGAATNAQAQDAFAYLHGAFEFEAKRFDVAIDDYEKGTPLELVAQAALDGQYAYSEQFQIIESGSRRNHKAQQMNGKTVYFGSSKSAKVTRCYDKAVESGGLIDAIRWETQLRDEKAKLTAWYWLQIEPNRLAEEGAKFLASIVTGAVRLCDRTGEDPNIERCPLLSWWADFVARTAEGVRIAIPAKKPLLEAKLAWLSNQVAPTLAMIRKVFGSGFQDYILALLAEGDDRHGSRHRSLIAAAVGDGWGAMPA